MLANWEAELRLSTTNEPVASCRFTEIRPEGGLVGHGSLGIWCELRWNERLDIQPGRAIAGQPVYNELDTLLNARIVLSWRSVGGLHLAELSSFGTMSRLQFKMSGVIPSPALDWIERQRNGDDVQLSVELQAVIQRSAWIGEGRGKDELGRQLYQPIARNEAIISAYARFDEGVIAASTWTKEFLPYFGYRGPRYIELPPLPDYPSAQSIRGHLESALSSIKAGGPALRSVPSACLNALDALAKSLNYPNFSSIPEPSSWIAPAAEERGKLLVSLKNYLNRWRHDNTARGSASETVPPITFEETGFIYLATIHLIDLMSRHLPATNSGPGN